jgi:hypothetical protein
VVPADGLLRRKRQIVRSFHEVAKQLFRSPGLYLLLDPRAYLQRLSKCCWFDTALADGRLIEIMRRAAGARWWLRTV